MMQALDALLAIGGLLLVAAALYVIAQALIIGIATKGRG